MSFDLFLRIASIAMLPGFLAALFVAAGSVLRTPWEQSAEATPVPLSLRVATHFFIGGCAFLAVFVPLSRVVGAALSMWALIALMAVAALLRIRLGRMEAKALVSIGACVLLLTAFFWITSAALWMPIAPPPLNEPTLLSHFGTIHAGRYANYAFSLAELDRVPFLDQNAGQVVFASLLLLLPFDVGPLAAVMAWLPLSLAFLSLLAFGLFRRSGASIASSFVGALVVMGGNIAFSTVHVLVFDNGSPLGFIGYTDLVWGVATFLIFALCVARVCNEGLRLDGSLRAIAIIALVWPWFAPQDPVVSAAGFAGLLVIGWRKVWAPRLRQAIALFVAFTALGALQLGPLLPTPLREDVGYWAISVPMDIAFRPYVAYIRNHWTRPTGSTNEATIFPVRPYEQAYRTGRSIGPDETYRNIAWFFEEQAWLSLRAYGVPILGLLLAFLASRHTLSMEAGERVFLWFTLMAFLAGYGVAFFFELGQNKWWLTRFLAPGAAAGMFFFAWEMLRGARAGAPVAAKSVGTIAIGIVLVGPLIEISAASARAYSSDAAESMGRRFERLVSIRGPMIFDDLDVFPGVRRTRHMKVIFIPDHFHGRAITTAALRRPAGEYQVRIRVTPPANPAGTAFEVVTRVDGAIGSRRRFNWPELESRPDGAWAIVPMTLQKSGTRLRVELESESEGGYSVTEFQVLREK